MLPHFAPKRSPHQPAPLGGEMLKKPQFFPSMHYMRRISLLIEPSMHKILCKRATLASFLGFLYH